MTDNFNSPFIDNTSTGGSNAVYIGHRRNGLPVIRVDKHHQWLKDIIFLGLSIVVGILTEGLGNIVFDALWLGTALSEGTALAIAGTVQTFFEVGGQIGVNFLEGRTSKSAIIASILPGFGVFGAGKIFKGLRIIKNERSFYQSLINRGVTEQTARQMIDKVSNYLVGNNIEESLFYDAIQNHNVYAVRTYKSKILRALGIGIKDSKESAFNLANSIKYGHVPDKTSWALFLDERLSPTYDHNWIIKTDEQRFRRWFGNKWVDDNFNNYQLEKVRNGIDDFYKKRLIAKDNLWNRTINKKRMIYRFVKRNVKVDQKIGTRVSWRDPVTGILRTSKTKTSPVGISSETEKIYGTVKKWGFEKRETRLIDYISEKTRSLLRPFSLVKPTNLIRRTLSFVERKTTKYSKKLEDYAVEKEIISKNYFTRFLNLIDRYTKQLRKLDWDIIRKYNLIPAVNSEWMIGFRIINELTVEIWYRNNSSGEIIQPIRVLTPYQFEMMVVAFESGQAGEFYLRELAYGWGLNKSWTQEIAISASALSAQKYLYTAYYAYRNIRSFNKGIKGIKSGSLDHYQWKQQIKTYGILRLIRSTSKMLGLGFIGAGLGVSLYRKKGWSAGIASSFARRTRTTIKRFKRRPYRNES